MNEQLWSFKTLHLLYVNFKYPRETFRFRRFSASIFYEAPRSPSYDRPTAGAIGASNAQRIGLHVYIATYVEVCDIFSLLS